MAERAITVEVVFADAHQAWRYRLSLPAGSTAMEAMEASGLAQQLPQGLPEPLQLGVFARRVPADSVLRDGDRVEIYRPLTRDPMAARRRRAGAG